MAVYIYKAIDSKGNMIKGEMEADTEIDLTTQLAKTGYLPISVSFKQAKAKPILALDKIFNRPAKVNPQALVIFTRQFATIIKAAVPIVEGLTVLAEQAEDPVLKAALQQIIKDVEGGRSLSSSFSKHPNVFQELYVNTVVAGESAGVLDKVLLRLALVLEEEQKTRSDISSALRYPIMVVIALVVAVSVLSIFVIPQFASIYSSFKAKLPLPTVVIINISKIMKNYWYIYIPVIFGLFTAFGWFINTRKGRFLWDGLKFKLPILGNIYTKITMLRFSSMLNVLYQAGLPILKIMDIIGITLGNVVLFREVEIVKHMVSEGKGISAAVLKSKFFPKLVGYMISVGEKSGSLPTMLDALSEYFDLEVKTMIKNLTTMIEPIMTAVLGFVVLGIALSIFLPLWNIISVVRSAR